MSGVVTKSVHRISCLRAEEPLLTGSTLALGRNCLAHSLLCTRPILLNFFLFVDLLLHLTCIIGL